MMFWLMVAVAVMLFLILLTLLYLSRQLEAVAALIISSGDLNVKGHRETEASIQRLKDHFMIEL